LLPGAPIVGGCVSNAVITWVTVAEWLPQASVASHVRVNTLLHEVPELVLVNKFTVAPLHASEAVGGVKSGLAVQSIVWLLPALPIAGGVISLIVIAWLTVAL
jgi:hypothetical protein